MKETKEQFDERNKIAQQMHAAMEAMNEAIDKHIGIIRFLDPEESSDQSADKAFDDLMEEYIPQLVEFIYNRVELEDMMDEYEAAEMESYEPAEGEYEEFDDEGEGPIILN
jgi:hypothetical protein